MKILLSDKDFETPKKPWKTANSGTPRLMFKKFENQNNLFAQKFKIFESE